WKPTGRHFSLFEKYPFTRIMESTDMPIELPPSASSSLQITMVFRFTDHKLSDRKAGSTNCSMVYGLQLLQTITRSYPRDLVYVLVHYFFTDKKLSKPRNVYAAILAMVDYKLGALFLRVYYVEGFKQQPILSFTSLLAYKSLFKDSNGYGIRCLNHLNFGTLNELARNDLFSIPLHMGTSADHENRIVSTEKKYVLVIVDDYTRLGWVRFLRTKDETPHAIEKFIVQTQRALNATVRFVRTDNGTDFSNACYTLNRSLVHTLHGKTYYELLKGKKPNLQYFRVFGSLCYPTNDYDDVGKLKAKADIGIFVGYEPPRRRRKSTTKNAHDSGNRFMLPTIMNFTEGLDVCSNQFRPRTSTNDFCAPKGVVSMCFDDDEVVPIPPVVSITPVNVPAAPAPENANGSPSTTIISKGAPAVTESLLPHQIPLPDTSDSKVTSFSKYPEASLSKQSKYALEILKKLVLTPYTPIDTHWRERLPTLIEDKGEKAN
ncbi:integrase, catalytic region, zinc finger, CCHC-type containing protein, partial [Tanacetum coccineum]